jgi:hypothetical protein
MLSVPTRTDKLVVTMTPRSRPVRIGVRPRNSRASLVEAVGATLWLLFVFEGALFQGCFEPSGWRWPGGRSPPIPNHFHSLTAIPPT